MDDATLAERLRALSHAARRQREAPYDHAAALRSSGVVERGDPLTPIAAAWAKFLPPGCATLADARAKLGDDLTGLRMAHVFGAAATAVEDRARGFD